MSQQAETLLALFREMPAEAQQEMRQLLLQQELQPPRETHREHQHQHSDSAPTSRRPLPSDQILEYLNIWRKALAAYLPYDQYHAGDENRLDLLRQETMSAMEPLERLFKGYFRYQVKGLENIPKKGRAIVVSNHGILPIDGWFLSYEIKHHTGRWPRGLTDWRIFRMPYIRQFFMDMGTLVGKHQNGDKLLQQEQLLFIMPGGSKEAWKSSRYRYRLLWQRRYGFIKLALRNQAPIIPSANVGTDDTYRVLFDGYTTSYKLFRTKKAMFPISIPIGLGPLPFPVQMTQYVGKPIRLPYPPEAENDIEAVKQCQEIVKARVYQLIDRGLREREERELTKYSE